MTKDRFPGARQNRSYRLVYVVLGALLTLLTACSSEVAASSGPADRPSGSYQTSTAPFSTAPSPGAPSSPSADPTGTAPPAGPAGAGPAALETGHGDGAIVAPVSAPIGLTVPSAGIDLAVLGLTPTAGEVAAQSIVPPFTLDAYWLTSYGSPGEGSTNTTYVTGHSWEDREAPFNRLSTDVVVGDPLTLTTETGALNYVVESVTTDDKETLKTSDIWDIVPHRLVIISCYTDDLWGKNVIVTAVPSG
ncbi:class F sortase [Arthrobacter sp. HLT1-21]